MSRTLVLLLGLVLSISCRGDGSRGAPPPHRGPIVLVTFDALRADVVGAFGGPGRLTPHLDSVAAEADWSGRAVAASSWTVPSMASIFTGLQPWLHGSWHGKATVLKEELETLPEALRAAGYRTAAFHSNHWLKAKFGYAQGFDVFRPLRGGRQAEQHLRQLDGGPDFVWIHILPPHAPYVYRADLVPRLPQPPGPLPERVRPAELERYFDPSVALPEEEKAVAWSMYCLNVARADALFGRLLAALEASGQWESTLLAVTSDHGEEFGEHGQVLHGGNLGRALIEVPLLVKLPRGFGRSLDLPPGRAVANLRLWATLVEAAGGSAQVAAPGLFSETDDGGVLSELYQGNGVNVVSLVRGDRQLVWTSRFAPPEPQYFAARAEELGAPLDEPLAEEPRDIFGRLARLWGTVPVLAGAPGTEPEISSWRWPAEGGAVLEAEGPEAIEEARRLRARWREVNGVDAPPATTGRGQGAELTAEDEAALKALGYT